MPTSDQIAFCYVDDQKDEIERTKKFLGERFAIGAGSSIKQALDDLKKQNRKPDLFLLDMYYQETGPLTDDQIRKLSEARAKVLKAEKEFNKVLAELGQTEQGGFNLLHSLRTAYHYKGPVAFFTRKGTLNNAIRAYEDGAIVIKKPDPVSAAPNINGEELHSLYDQAFQSSADHIAAAIEVSVHRSRFLIKYRGELVGLILGMTASIGAWALVTLLSHLF